GPEPPIEEARGFEAGDDDGQAVVASDGLVLPIAHPRADMPGAEEAAYTVARRLKHRRDRGRHQHMGDEHGEVRESERPRLRHRQRIRGRRGFEADREKDDLAFRMLLGELHGVERRVDDAHVGTLGLESPEIRPRPWPEPHLAERRADDTGALGDRMPLVDLFERRHTARAAGSMHELDLGGQQTVPPVLHDGMRLPAAHLHQRPRLRHQPTNLGHHLGGETSVTVLVEVLHEGISGAPRSPSWSSSSRNLYVRRASSGSPRLSAKPTWTST